VFTAYTLINPATPAHWLPPSSFAINPATPAYLLSPLYLHKR